MLFPIINLYSSSGFCLAFRHDVLLRVRVQTVRLIARIHHLQQLRVFNILQQFLLSLVYLFTFAWRENLLYQSLDCVVVDSVRVDVTTKLMQVPTLHTNVENSFVLYR